MSHPNILCIDDQRDVLATLRRDLAPLASRFTILEAESAAEARQLLTGLMDRAEPLALIICDHIMPGTNGIDFLIGINHDPSHTHVFKMLLTGLATHEDTIRAINEANIDYYLQKPWATDALLGAVRRLLTRWIVHEGIDFRQYLEHLDKDLLFTLLRQRV